MKYCHEPNEVESAEHDQGVLRSIISTMADNYTLNMYAVFLFLHCLPPMRLTICCVPSGWEGS